MKLLPVVTAFTAGLIVGLNLSASDPVGAGDVMERGSATTEYPPLAEQPQHIPPPPPGPYQSQSMLSAPVPPRAGGTEYAPLNYAPEGSAEVVAPSQPASGYPDGAATRPNESHRSTVGKVPLPVPTGESQYPKAPSEGLVTKPSSPYYKDRSQLGAYEGAPAGARAYPRQGGPAASAPQPPPQQVYPSYTEENAPHAGSPRSNTYMPPSYNPYGTWSGMRHPYGTPPNPWQGAPGSGFSDYPAPNYSPYQRPRYYAPRYPRP